MLNHVQAIQAISTLQYITQKNLVKNLLMETLQKPNLWKSCIGVLYESDRLKTLITDIEQNLNILYVKSNGLTMQFLYLT